MDKISWSMLPWWLKTLIVLQVAYFSLMLVWFVIGFAEGVLWAIAQ